MKWFSKNSGKFCVLFYLLVLFHVSNLCMYGGIVLNTILIFISMGCLIGSFAVWFTSQNDHEQKKFKPLGIVLMILGTLIFGARIIFSAIPYNGELSWVIDDIMSNKKVVLTNSDFFETGITGILEDLKQEEDLPEELYIDDTLQIQIDNEGEIQYFDSILYGKSLSGIVTEYHIHFYNDSDKKMDVWVNEDVKQSFDPDMKLEPAIFILENAPYQEQIRKWSQEDPYREFEIIYAGRRSFARNEGLVYVPGDADQDGKVSGIKEFPDLREGGKICGYEVSMHIPFEENILPMRYIMEPEYVAPELMDENAKIEKQDLHQIYTEVEWVTNEDNSVYYYVHERTGWRLIMDETTDYYYRLQKTNDGAETWRNVNIDPFPGDTGTACGLRFYNTDLGFAMTTDGSGLYANVYVTWDGGKNFEKIVLPEVKQQDLPADAKYRELSFKDYKYIMMPRIVDDELQVQVFYEEWDDEGIVFRSPDRGKTWIYYGTTEI